MIQFLWKDETCVVVVSCYMSLYRLIVAYYVNARLRFFIFSKTDKRYKGKSGDNDGVTENW